MIYLTQLNIKNIITLVAGLTHLVSCSCCSSRSLIFLRHRIMLMTIATRIAAPITANAIIMATAASKCNGIGISEWTHQAVDKTQFSSSGKTIKRYCTSQRMQLQCMMTQSWLNDTYKNMKAGHTLFCLPAFLHTFLTIERTLLFLSVRHYRFSNIRSICSKGQHFAQLWSITKRHVIIC